MSASSLAPAHELDVRIAALPENAARLRAVLREFLRTSSLCETRCYDVLIAVGEAASNAIEHGYRGADGEIRMQARFEPVGMTIEIHDGGTWRHDGDPERGRGLSIMRALMDSVEIVSSRGGTLVRLALRVENFVAA